MPRPPITWVTSDWHLWNDKIIEFGPRPDDFTDLILRNHRYVVSTQDTLINLGDVAFYGMERLGPFLAHIPGRHVLVRGNHDHKSNNWYLRNGYDWVCDMLVIGDVLLSHKPVDQFPEGVAVNVHGHLHRWGDRVGEHPYLDPSRHILVAMELTDYKPLNLQQLVANHRARYTVSREVANERRQ